MSSKAQPKGPWVHRFLIRLFTAIFAVLVYWVLGFLVKDIQSIAGPQYDVIEKAHVDQKLVTKQQRLNGDRFFHAIDPLIGNNGPRKLLVVARVVFDQPHLRRLVDRLAVFNQVDAAVDRRFL